MNSSTEPWILDLYPFLFSADMFHCVTWDLIAFLRLLWTFTDLNVLTDPPYWSTFLPEHHKAVIEQTWFNMLDFPRRWGISSCSSSRIKMICHWGSNNRLLCSSLKKKQQLFKFYGRTSRNMKTIITQTKRSCLLDLKHFFKPLWQRVGTRSLRFLLTQTFL